ncbi:CU044_2847 family protein [Streptomyces sp. NPDC001787]|uniref:CU044_2847 family protein n=1 Tax=Streptomyces sp. NPDC001787 TaxID=3154523 RepID=UPI003318DE72
MGDNAQLIWVPLDGEGQGEGESAGERVAVEVSSGSSGIVRAARPGEIAGTAARSLAESFDQVRAAAALLLDRMTTMPSPPDTVEVELGVKINAEAGAIIAKTAAEGNFTIRLTWERGEGVAAGEQEGPGRPAVPADSSANG